MALPPASVGRSKTPVSSSARRVALALATPCLVAMASLPAGLCSSRSYRVTIEVPPRRAPVGIQRLVVQDFTPPGWGNALADGLRSQIAAQGYIQPVSRGAPAVLSGGVGVDRVLTTRHQTVQQREVKESGRKVTRQFVTHIVRKKASVSVRYSLTEAGRVLAGNTYTRHYDKSFFGTNPAAAEANAPTDDQIVGSLLAELASEVVRDVSPHKTTRELPLRAGTHPGLAQGITYMRHHRFEQALEIWDQVAEVAPDAKDKAAAYYNIGVIREARGEYADAFEMFSRADSLVPGEKNYIGAMTRVERNEAARDALGSAGVSGGPSKRLTVRARPERARVRIMNIVPRYQDGIALAPGSYDILVDAPGYAPHRQWIRVRDQDVVLDVRLEAQ